MGWVAHSKCISTFVDAIDPSCPSRYANKEQSRKNAEVWILPSNLTNGVAGIRSRLGSLHRYYYNGLTT